VPRPHERKKAVIIGPAITAQNERRAVIFRGGREHWPLTRTTGGRPRAVRGPPHPSSTG